MTWRRVDPYFARRIQLVAFIVAVGFGLDYLFTPAGSSTALTSIERAWVPLWVWGIVIIAAGVAGLIVEGRILGKDHPMLPSAARRRWGWVSNIAHIALLAIFAALAMSALGDVVTRGWHTGQWYGWRTPLLWGGFGYINLQFVRRLTDPWR